MDDQAEMQPYTRFSTFFEAIPSGVLSCFLDHCYLFININFETEFFHISSAPDRIWPSGYPLNISGCLPWGSSASSNHISPVLELIRSMPKITQLELEYRSWRSQTWEIPHIIGLPNSFPHLETLGLKFWFNRWWRRLDVTVPLNSLPVGLKLKKLILTDAGIFAQSIDPLLDAVSRTGVETLELYGHVFSHPRRILDDALRDKGVVLVRSSRKKERWRATKCFCQDSDED